MKQFDAVILADGEFPTSEIALGVLRNAKYLCLCDHAGKRYLELLENGELEGYPYPDAIVGDGDSVSDAFRDKHTDIYHKVAEQDYNDLTKATRFVVSRFQKVSLRQAQDKRQFQRVSIAYLGTTGKREDHTIGNIFLLPFYQQEFNIEAIFFTNYGYFVCGKGEQTFESFPRQQVSIFNINSKSLTGENLKWAPYCYKELWQGTLNEALGSTFTIHADGQYIIYRTYDPKA